MEGLIKKIVANSPNGLAPPPQVEIFSLAKNDLYAMKQILYDTGLWVVTRWPLEGFEIEKINLS